MNKTSPLVTAVQYCIVAYRYRSIQFTIYIYTKIYSWIMYMNGWGVCVVERFDATETGNYVCEKFAPNLFVNVNMFGSYFWNNFLCVMDFIYRFAGFNLCWTYGHIARATSAFYIDLRTTTSIKHETTGTNNIRSSKFFGRLSKFAGGMRHCIFPKVFHFLCLSLSLSAYSCYAYLWCGKHCGGYKRRPNDIYIELDHKDRKDSIFWMGSYQFLGVEMSLCWNLLYWNTCQFME